MTARRPDPSRMCTVADRVAALRTEFGRPEEETIPRLIEHVAAALGLRGEYSFPSRATSTCCVLS